MSPPELNRFLQWLDLGYAGTMDYMAGRVDAYRHPSNVLSGAQSILVLGCPYDCDPIHPADALERPASPFEHEPSDAPETSVGRIARYVWSGLDYHDVLHRRLKPIKRMIETHIDGCRARPIVDTAPLAEREFAQLAGLGWRGKNTLLLHPDLGSYFFLAAILVDRRIEPDDPFVADHCGTCTACLDACPTDAFVAPGLLDARRCISYLTIENQGMPDASLRRGIGDWLFGCDVCQEVCPWNGRRQRLSPTTLSPTTLSPTTLSPTRLSRQPTLATLRLAELFRIDETEFRRRFRKTPLWRAKRRGLLRNAAIVMGNHAHQYHNIDPSINDAVDDNHNDTNTNTATRWRTADTRWTRPLSVGLWDSEPLVRAASAWALGQVATPTAYGHLQDRSTVESHPDVQAELANIHAAA